MVRSYWVTVIITLLIAGCSTLTDFGAKMAGSALGIAEDDGMSVELDAQIGDRKNDVDSQIGGVKGTGEVKADRGAKVMVVTKAAESNVEKAEKVEVTNNKQAPFWLIALLVIGWILPDPMQMWRAWRGGKSDGAQ